MRAFRLLALRRLRQQPLRATIAVFAVASGVALGVAILVTRTSVDRSVQDFGRTLAGPAELRVVGPTPRGGLPEAVVASVAEVEGVGGVVPLVQAISVVDPAAGGAAGADAADGSHSVVVLGVDCRVEQLIGPFGCTPELLAGDRPLALGPGVDPAGSVRTDLGRIDVAGVPVTDSLAAINGGRVAVLPLPAAQRRFLQEGRVDVAYVLLADGTDVTDLRARLDDALGDHLGVLGIDDPPPETQIALVSFLPLFTLLGLFGLGTGAVLVRNTVALSLEERRRQLAIAAAVGADGRRLIGWAVSEAAALGLLGGVLGALGGIVVAGPIVEGLSVFTEDIAGVPIVRHVSASAIVIGALLGAVVGGASAVGPARRAARLDVAAELSGRSLADSADPVRLGRRLLVWSAVSGAGALVCWLSQRGGGIDPWQASVGPLAFLAVTLGTLMVGAAVAPLVVAAAARVVAGTRRATWVLAFAELARDPKRTGVMAVAVASPVIVGFATDGFVSSARASIESEVADAGPGVSVSTIDVDGGSDAFLAPEAQAALGALPGVDAVLRGTYLSAGHDVFDLVGVETFDDPDFDDIDLLRGRFDPDRFAAGDALIGPNLARRTGARPGGTIELPSLGGVVEVPVLGVLASGDFGGQSVLLHRERFDQLYGSRPPSYVVLRSEPGVSDEELAATVRAAAPSIDPELRVRTREELVGEVVDSIDEQMLPFRAMQQTLLLVAFVAVLSTLLLAGLQRRREHGLLSAVGAEPAALRRVILGEASVVAGAALLHAAIVGPVVLWTMLQVIPVLIGARNPFRADWASLLSGGAAAVVGVLLAAAWPAWRASRVEVLDALRYE